MDTLKYYKIEDQQRKAFEYAYALILLLILALSPGVAQQPIFANDLIANTVITAPTLKHTGERVLLNTNANPYILEEQFEQRIQTKYNGLTVHNVDKGIKHVKLTKYYAGKPVRINVVEMNHKIASNYEVKPATASTWTLHHKTTLRTIAGRTNSIVAINGGFFKPQTGVPLGTLMIDGKIYTGPIYNRVAMGIFEDGYDVGRVSIEGKITGNGHTIKIDNINQPRILSSYVLAYTRDWGKYAPASPKYGVQLQIEGNRILAASANPLSIPENGYVLVGPKEVLGKLFGAQHVDAQIGMNPEWKNVKHIISGGPYLVRNGNVYIDTYEEKLTAISGRNPRTAIGYTKDNDLILVAVDGREGSSIGMTLYELANFMKSLGCINAINLDGGGSTVMYVDGMIVNNPQQIGGIALSNALVVARKN